MNPLLTHLLHASLATCVLVPLVLGARRLLRQQIDHRLLYAAWLLLALRLVVPLSVPISSAASGLIDEAPALAQALPANSGAAAALNGDAAAPGMSIPVGTQVTLLWAAGAGLTAACMAVRNIRFRRSLFALPMEPSLWESHRQQLCGLGLSLPPVRISPAVSSPCLYGALRPVILLPEEAIWQAWMPYALLHESCHAKAQDTRWALLRMALCCLFWFHPLVWLAAKVSRVDAELACDARVTAHIAPGERFDYARALVGIAARHGMSAAPSAGAAFADDHLSSRIEHIVRRQSPRKRLAAVLACVLTLVLAISFVTAESAPEAITSKDGAQLFTPAEGNAYDSAPLGDAAFTVHYIHDGWAWVETEAGAGYVALDALNIPLDWAKDTTAWVHVAGERDTLNLRNAPTVEVEAITSFFFSAPVTILSFGKTWCQVKGEGIEGYMMTQFLLIGAEEMIPYVPAPPALPEAS